MKRFGMDRLVIRGGNELNGSVQINGAKNAALPQIAAVLLAAEPLELGNVPDLLDVTPLFTLIEGVGGRTERRPGRPFLDSRRGRQTPGPPWNVGRRARAIL